MTIAVATAARLGRKAALLMAIAATATLPAAAQTVPDDQVPAAGLDLPANLQIFGKADPNVRKPTAIVNDSVITGTDVDQRVALARALNPELRLNEEQLNQLRLQVLRQVIDETLQIQEAAAQDVKIEAADLDRSFATVSKNFNRTPEQMRSWLREIGSSERALKRQIEGELAWSRLLRRRVSPLINVSEEEVKAIFERMRAQQGTEEYALREIYIAASPDRADQVRGAMQQMVEQMRQGAPFEYYARNFSEATTRASGGDLGFIRLATLPESLQQAVRQMGVGQLAGPIEAPGGFSLLYLYDKRQILTADPRDAKLNLRQISLRFPEGTTEARASELAARFGEATKAMQGCGDVAETAAQFNADVIDDDSRRIRDLPPQLGDLMLNLQVGEATQPFGSIEEGIRVLVLCGRDEVRGGEASLPSIEEMQSAMENERVNLRAQRMLRDMRRDALIYYQ